MIVTVTGANGFIGSHLVEDQLARGRTVRAVDISLSKLEALGGNPSVELFEADIREEERMGRVVRGCDVVFHLASAHLSVALSDEEYWKINCEGSKAFVKLCHLSGVRRFVHCSSVGVHGAIKTPPASENSECHPDLVYERTKLEGEKGVQKYANTTGFPVVIVRPVWVYGPGCPRTEKLFRTIKKRRFFFVGNGLAQRHCVYITDMVAAFNLCAEHPKAPGKVFIIGDPTSVTVRELIEQMATTVGVPSPRLSIPLSFANALCFFIERGFSILGKEPPFSERSLKFFTNNTSFDTSRARKELGFVPKVKLYHGLRLAYEAMKESESPRGVA